MNALKPARLKKGDTIGIMSPSKYLDEEKKQGVVDGIKVLESLGFKVTLGKHVWGIDKYQQSAATPEERASDLNEMFADKNINVTIEHITLHLIFNNGGQSMKTPAHVCVPIIIQATAFIRDMNH